MEDYTYDLSGEHPRVLGAHMLEVCESIAAGKPALEIHPLSIGGKEDPPRLVFDVAPGAAVNVTLLDLGDRFRMVVNPVDVVLPDKPLPQPAGGAGRVDPATRPEDRGRCVDHGRRSASHRVQPVGDAGDPARLRRDGGRRVPDDRP